MQNSALIAMSGGVDSSVAAWLTLNDGFDCEGAVMKLHNCGDDGIAQARSAAEQLRIPIHTYDFSEYFAEKVINRFISAYREGRTPNPCIDCNRYIKFGLLYEKALELGKKYLVTGHYARIEQEADGRFILKKGSDPAKDQSYVLYNMTQKQLSQTRFPLGALTKSDVREIATQAGLKNAKNTESQDICFVPDGRYAEFIEEYTGETSAKARFVDIDGNYLGESKGTSRRDSG